jgi:pimeloyl-ACP methyl ester carboxylesterase
VLLHGFMDTWRIWELVLPALERRHEVLALTLPGHAGGPPFGGDAVGEVERMLDVAGIETAHVAGNSLGGWLALQLAARGRARTVVAFAPAGGWAGDPPPELFAFQRELHAQMKAAAPNAPAVLATDAGRRRATELLTVRYEHIPAELLAHQVLGGAVSDAPALLANAAQADWTLDAARVDCPVRIVWGTEDRLLPWPSAAERYRRDWLPHADWVVLDGVGHCPQLDVPLETAELILGFTS